MTRTIIVFDEAVEIPTRTYLRYQNLYNWTEEEMCEDIERELTRKGGDLCERTISQIERKIKRTESVLGKESLHDKYVSCTPFDGKEVFIPVELVRLYEKVFTRLNLIQIEGLLMSELAEGDAKENLMKKNSEELSELVVSLIVEELEVYTMIPNAVRRAKAEFEE